MRLFLLEALTLWMEGEIPEGSQGDSLTRDLAQPHAFLLFYSRRSTGKQLKICDKVLEKETP